MTVIDDPFEPTDPSDAALDRLLAQAQWDVSIDAEDRLRQRWIALSPGAPGRTTTPVYGMLAAAAAIALAVGTIFLVHPHENPAAIAPIVTEPNGVKYLMLPADASDPLPHVESWQATLLGQLGDGSLVSRVAAAKALAEMDPDVSLHFAPHFEVGTIDSSAAATIRPTLAMLDQSPLTLRVAMPLTQDAQDDERMSSFTLRFTP